MSNTNTNIDALRAIQMELKAPKSKYNSFGKFHYRSLEDILEGVKPFLVQYGASLHITDDVNNYGSTVVLTAKVVFTDANGKQTIVTAHAGVEPKKGMDIAQAFGASSSYARKYALNGLFLIDDTQDPDTDAFHHQNNGQGQNNRNQNQSNAQDQNTWNQHQRANGQGQNTRNQNQRNNQSQPPQNKSWGERYQDALNSIRQANRPATLDKAIDTFQNSQYSEGIAKACQARADQMGWTKGQQMNGQNNQARQ